MEWAYYFVVGITFLVYSLAALVSLWVTYFLYRIIFHDIIERRKSIVAAMKSWKK